MNFEPSRLYTPERLFADLQWALSVPSLTDARFDLSHYASAHGLEKLENPFERSIAFTSLAQKHPWLLRDGKSARRLRASLYERIHASLARHKNRSLRLGVYFEELLDVWLHAHPDVDVEASHDAIHDQDGRTLGELDWVLRAKGQELHEHWECAVKLYIAASKAQTLDAFRGPNRDDHMARKLDHMLFQQLPLSLARFEDPEPYCSMVGTLFFRWKPGDPDWTTVGGCASSCPATSSARLSWLNPEATARAWISEEHLEPFIRFSLEKAGLSLQATTWTVELPKALWMAPVEGTVCEGLSPLDAGLSERLGAALAALVRRDSTSTKAAEITRFFIIPKHLVNEYEAI